MENEKAPLKTRISSGFQKYLRVWKLLKKPSYQEFKMVSKISALGILLIGAIGFIVSIVLTLLQSNF
jgi:protein transport protein SEC61 subunit gamma-like protein